MHGRDPPLVRRTRCSSMPIAITSQHPRPAHCGREQRTPLAVLFLYFTQYRRNQNALRQLAAERERLRETEFRNRQIVETE